VLTGIKRGFKKRLKIIAKRKVVPELRPLKTGENPRKTGEKNNYGDLEKMSVHVISEVYAEHS